MEKEDVRYNQNRLKEKYELMNLNKGFSHLSSNKRPVPPVAKFAEKKVTH